MMPGKMSDSGTMPEKIMESECDAGEDEESEHDARKVMKSGQAPEKGLGEYREGCIWASTGKVRIRASAGKVEIWASVRKVESRRVPEK